MGTVVPFPSVRAAPRASPSLEAAPATATTAGQVLPLAAVLLTAVVAQVALAPHLAPGGAVPDLLLLSTAAVAVYRGREAGAAYGFAAGLAADLFVATPMGLNSLAFTGIGHVLGGRGSAWRPPKRTAMLGGSACLGGDLLVVSLGRLLAGAGPMPGLSVSARLLGGAVVAAVLAPPVFAAIRRVPLPPSDAPPAVGGLGGRRKEGFGP